MKELSIEEKARLYDKALKVLHKYDGANIMFSQSLKEEMFPELAESDDDRIRKDIIKAFKLFKEKQTWVGHCLDDIDWDACISWLEKQAKQKYADNAEPKFNVNVGDWLIHNERKHIVKVIHATPLIYEVVNKFGDYHTITNNAIENNYHLWTIQDAKDGDVLCCESGWTCIFKKLNHNSFGGLLFDSYCFIDRTGWFCDGAEGHTLDERINGRIYPATKEQRDTLIKAMADAGYTFDFEKKELKKIEKN